MGQTAWARNDQSMDTLGEEAEMPEECCKELRITKEKTHNLAAIEVKPVIGDVIDCLHEGRQFQETVRVTAYIIRAVKAFKDRKAR